MDIGSIQFGAVVVAQWDASVNNLREMTGAVAGLVLKNLISSQQVGAG